MYRHFSETIQRVPRAPHLFPFVVNVLSYYGAFVTTNEPILLHLLSSAFYLFGFGPKYLI